jgi:hypothetical protein
MGAKGDRFVVFWSDRLYSSAIPRFAGADLHYVRWPELGAEMPAVVHLCLGEAGLLKGTITRTRRDSEEP